MKNHIEAIIFDWAGTIVDHGSFAPTKVLVDAFKSMDIDLDLNIARGPMGKAKWDHIKELCEHPDISRRWQEKYQRAPNDHDVDALYERFLPLQIEKVGEYSQPIPGALELFKALRQQNIKIGSCTGYPARVMEHVLVHANQHQLMPDYVVACDEVAQARPYPAMVLKNLLHFNVSDVANCVKVDDTPVGIEEGKNAGVWTVGLTCSGNILGLTHEELLALSNDDLQILRHRAEQEFKSVKPDFMIDSIAHLPQVLNSINQRIKAGIRPNQLTN